MTPQERIEKAHQAFAQLNDQELVDAGIHKPDNYFMPIITYPAMSKMPAATADQLIPFGTKLQQPTAVYIHIPFCITRCLFCHWVIKLNTPEDEVARYLKCLDLEFERHRQRYGLSGKINASSILVGGGTPTLLSPAHMKMFFDIVHKHVDMDKVTQFSYEGEPSTLLGDIGAERLRMMVDYGVNRVSYGVQAFNDALLKQNGRHHTAQQAIDAINRSHQFGISSVSIDLIYGLTGQTTEDWIDTMNTAVQSGADAWQLYRLRIVPHGDRPGTVVKHAQKRPDLYAQVEETLIMKMIGIQISEENGFPQLYTRIFARTPNDISFYLNDVNSKLSDVVSVGISSWGNVNDTYVLNVGNDFESYYRLIDEGGLPINRGMKRDADNEARHCFILQLKNTCVNKALFEARIKRTVHDCFGETIEHMKKFNLISEDEQFISLTERGKFYADQVVEQFTASEFRPSTPARPVTLGVKKDTPPAVV